MVSLHCVGIAHANLTLVNDSAAYPPTFKISGLPNLFGVCVYSFMCHHSLPGLVTPINKKKKLYSLILGDYALNLPFYIYKVLGRENLSKREFLFKVEAFIKEYSVDEGLGDPQACSGGKVCRIYGGKDDPRQEEDRQGYGGMEEEDGWWKGYAGESHDVGVGDRVYSEE